MNSNLIGAGEVRYALAAWTTVANFIKYGGIDGVRGSFGFIFQSVVNSAYDGVSAETKAKALEGLDKLNSLVDFIETLPHQLYEDAVNLTSEYLLSRGIGWITVEQAVELEYQYLSAQITRDVGTFWKDPLSWLYYLPDHVCKDVNAKWSELQELAYQVKQEVNYGLITQNLDNPVIKYDVA